LADFLVFQTILADFLGFSNHLGGFPSFFKPFWRISLFIQTTLADFLVFQTILADFVVFSNHLGGVLILTLCPSCLQLQKLQSTPLDKCDRNLVNTKKANTLGNQLCDQVRIITIIVN
jgi:hypothetical protein